MDAEDIALDAEHRRNEMAQERNRQSMFYEKKNMYVVCYHLPVSISRVELLVSNGPLKSRFEITWSDSIISKSQNDSVSSYLTTHWMGTIEHADSYTSEELREITEILHSMKCIPIFLDRVEENNFYLVSCIQI